MGQINVAIIGVGNCASALVQGVNKYKEAEGDKQIPGIMNNELGGYSVGDLNIVAAFDVDEDKVEFIKAYAYRLEPIVFNSDADGIYSLDGEVVEYGPIQASVLPAAARVASTKKP